MFSKVSLTSSGEDASLALFYHLCIVSVMIRILNGEMFLLHRPDSTPFLSVRFVKTESDLLDDLICDLEKTEICSYWWCKFLCAQLVMLFYVT